ncbi:MAG TPA: 3-phosphoglycerate dehydrogenase [Bacteroidales bacterium]|nr:3-phosphoglycerate dehydrogenase [Bacteroidales bacterium]
MKVLVATDKPFAPIAVEGIRTVVEKAGYKLSLLEKYTDTQQFLDAVADANALIVRSDKVTAEVLAAAHNLKIVVRAGAGYDNLDLEACTRHGVVAMNTPGQNSNAVAELAFGMMVYNARGGFDGNPGTELRGKKLGIHAYGNVGKYVAGIARGFGMDIYAYDPFVSADVISSDNVKPLNSADDLYSTCQYVSLHLPANNETKGSIGFNLLTKMPHNAVLVNTARKEVINEEELLKVMATRPDFSYLSDIAPDCASEFAEKHPGRFFFTPKKMGAQTSEANINAGVAAAEQIVAFIKDGVDTFKVN